MSAMIVHEIFEMGRPRGYPIVTHLFRGETREEAYAVYLAHLESDAFLRGCVENDEYLLSNGTAVKCTVRWWYDDDDARDARIARAFIEAERSSARVAGTLGSAASPGREFEPQDGPPLPERDRRDDRTPRGFRPRVIEGGAGETESRPSRPPGHEHHDPNVCDVRTG